MEVLKAHEVIKEARIKLGLTIAEAAERAGIADNVWKRWESGMRKGVPPEMMFRAVNLVPWSREGSAAKHRRLIIKMREDGMTLAEIGKVLGGVSRQRVHQILNGR